MKKILIPIVLLLSILYSCQTVKTGTYKKTYEPADKAPDWSKNAVIYEVNIRQYSKEGTLNKVTQDLDRLKKLGVDILWLMPIHPIGEKNRKGTQGSYYAVKDYKAVNPNYGTLEDFKNLVKIAHSKNMKVIIDWVANHSSPDNVWVKDHLDYYTKDKEGNAPIPTVGTDWIDVADLNYDNPNMRKAMEEAMIYWIKEADIDGFRCDVAEMVPLDFWTDVRPKLDAIKPIFMLAEGAKPELFKAFDMIYGWPFKDHIKQIAEGKKTYKEITKYRDTVYTKLDPKDNIMYFTTNHDENSWNYLEKDVFKNNLYNYSALTIMMGGMPLVYSGQENGLDKKLKFFEKDPIEWGNYKNTTFYVNLFKIYKTNPALWNGKDKGIFKEIKTKEKDLYAFTVEKNNNKVTVIQNYSTKITNINIPSTLQNTKEVEDKLSLKKIAIKNNKIDIPANTTYIFTN